MQYLKLSLIALVLTACSASQSSPSPVTEETPTIPVTVDASVDAGSDAAPDAGPQLSVEDIATSYLISFNVEETTCGKISQRILELITISLDNNVPTMTFYGMDKGCAGTFANNTYKIVNCSLGESAETDAGATEPSWKFSAEWTFDKKGSFSGSTFIEGGYPSCKTRYATNALESEF